MKKLLLILLAGYSLSALAVGLDAVTVIADAPAQQREVSAKIDATKTLQTAIDGISKAQSTAQQIQALKNLQNLQNNPGASISQVNSAVSGLVSNFNTLNNSSFQNLSQLISSVGSSTSSMGMNIQLMQASNMQLSAIQNTLQTLQAQNQAIIAYKQAEVNEQDRQQAAEQQHMQNTANALNGL